MKYKRHRFCFRCGACCSDLLPVSAIEIAIIREYVRRKNIKDTQPDPTCCPFLRRHSCAIYHIRPHMCREYHCKMSHEEFLDVAMRQMKETRPRSMRAEIFGKPQ